MSAADGSRRILSKSIVTAALLVAWSVLCFVGVVWFAPDDGVPSACLKDPTQCRIGEDRGPLFIAFWIVGLIAIVAVRQWMYRRRPR